MYEAAREAQTSVSGSPIAWSPVRIWIAILRCAGSAIRLNSGVQAAMISGRGSNRYSTGAANHRSVDATRANNTARRQETA